MVQYRTPVGPRLLLGTHRGVQSASVGANGAMMMETGSPPADYFFPFAVKEMLRCPLLFFTPDLRGPFSFFLSPPYGLNVAVWVLLFLSWSAKVGTSERGGKVRSMRGWHQNERHVVQ